ncbi:penicillin acylase family protein [Kordiimonas aquimaris]|uniref:penicillin acylase family protein n=1 Tax=Kordiimonas aquimaris TaxID=707591 RepID=UPI0021D3769F|nr:penicillin acylase family protein [Kordiimonas aquimaris]
MRTIKFWLIFIGSLLLTFAIIAFGWMKSSLPEIDGTFYLDGPSAEIIVARDQRGVPHIDAANEQDLAFAAGYVHAQDRLWQMEMNRRIGHGRVAEVLGEAGLGFDRYFRTLGFTHRAQSALDHLPADVTDNLEKYADGVNAYLNEHKGALPPEFLLTGITPEPWKTIDTLVWQKMMWLDLSGNARQELARARLLTKLTPAQVASIYAPYPGDSALPLPELKDIFSASPIAAAALAMGPEKPAGYGSNNWVVDGTHTESGMPLLANDPHLGLTTPSIWYLMRLHNRSNGENVVGVTFPGSPSIVLGRNDKISWGFTNTAPDIMDLYIEKVVGEDSYLTPTGTARFKTRTETILIRGGAREELVVRETRHGPVVSDIYTGSKDILDDDHVIALQWTALMDRDDGVVGLQKLGAAIDFASFQAAGSFYAGPQQNMIYADTDGNIGYYAPGMVPVRHPDNQIGGRLPSPGWDATYDWQGFIPYNELPTRFNPDGGVIATANEKIVDDNYPHFITGDWALPYRGNRIRHQLASVEKHTLGTFGELHSDVVSDMARDIMPWLLSAVQDSTHKTMLADWNGAMNADAAEPLIFYTWIRHYQKLLVSDELGDLYSNYTGHRPRLVKSSLYWSQTKGENNDDWNTGYYALPVLDQDISLSWCDDVTTNDSSETCTELANQAMNTAIAELSTRYGNDANAWQWGAEHLLFQSHRPMSQIPGMKGIYELAAPVPGGRFTVNVGGVSQNPNTMNHSTYGPSYRGIFDMSDPDKSLYVQPTGQSGNPFSDHYGDMFQTWLDVDYFTIPTATTVPENVTAIMTLRPRNE